MCSLSLLTLAAVAVSAQLAYAVYQVFFSPLRHIPGPWWAPVTNWFLVIHARQKDAHLKIISLHRTFGDTIRMGPNTM